MNLYCPNCNAVTEQTPQSGAFVTTCNVCKHPISRLEQAQIESNVFTAPDGTTGKLVKNEDGVVVFQVEEGDRAGLYVYDMKSGFGGVQHHML